MFYDVYLGTNGCKHLPDLTDLANQIPEINDPHFLNTLITWSRTRRFLGLNLSEELAREFYLRCRALNAVGGWLPAVYRQPQVTKEQALLIAKKAFQKMNETEFHDDPLGSAFYRGDSSWVWVFGAATEKMKRSGKVPGCRSVSVDKVDGHIWEHEEFMAIARKRDEVEIEIRKRNKRNSA